MTTINLPPLSIPEISVGTGLVTATSGTYYSTTTGYGSDITIYSDPNIVEGILHGIVRDEMRRMREKAPSIDYVKLQEMVRAGDQEMRELGYRILSEHTRYVVRILSSLGKSDIQLEILRDYNTLNMGNIGEIL